MYPKLDITSKASITSLFEKVSADDGRVDVLINNAGVNTMPDTSSKAVKLTLDTNYRGTLAVCQTFLPLMAENGRVVNVSSVGSSLNIYSPTIQQRFRNPEMTLQELEDMAREYQNVADRDEEQQAGWGGKGQAYSVSKACVNALTRILARERKGVAVNCCCPGWVDTDMGGIMGKPSKSVGELTPFLAFSCLFLPFPFLFFRLTTVSSSFLMICFLCSGCEIFCSQRGETMLITLFLRLADGAKIPVRLALGDVDGSTGEYWSNPSIHDKGEGQITEW